MINKINLYLQLMRFHQPAGILLLLWPALWALWIAAEGKPAASLLIIFILGVIVMRSAGCVFNDYADRKFDIKVTRTCKRPLTTGQVSPLEAMILFGVLCLLALVLVLFLNLKTIMLSMVALALALIYPFMKRITYFPQLCLGLAFAWSIPMAFMATNTHIPAYAWVIFVITVIWTVIYDTQYAMIDRNDDVQIGIKSTAIWFGEYDIAMISAFFVLFFGGLVFLGMLINFGWVYYCFIFASLLLASYQIYLIKDRLPHHCLKSFLNNQWLGLLIFLGISLNYLH